MTAVAQQSAQIESRLKQAQAESPQSFAANHNLGEFYLQQKQLSLAIPYLEKAQQADPQHYTNSHDLALAYFMTSDLDKARGLLGRMLQTHRTAELHHLLGEVEEKAGDVKAAAAAYYQAAQLEPSEKHLLSLCNLLVKSENFAEADKFFAFGFEKYPRSSQLKVSLGIAEYAQGKFDQAVKTLCEASDLDPTDLRPYLFLGEMYAVSAAMAGEIDARLARFVKLHPREAKAHYYYGLSLWKGKRDGGDRVDLKQIEGLLREAARLDPAFADSFFHLGVLYFDQQRYADAAVELRRAIKLKPEMAQAHYRLGQTLQRLGQAEAAQKELEIFRQLKAKENHP